MFLDNCDEKTVVAMEIPYPCETTVGHGRFNLVQAAAFVKLYSPGSGPDIELYYKYSI